MIYAIKLMYEDLLKKKDFVAIEELKYALAFTGADGLVANENDLNLA